MQKKIGVVFGALLAVVAFSAFAATAGATTVTPANTGFAVSELAGMPSTFVAANGMGALLQCTTVTAAGTTPTSTDATPNNNAGDTTTFGSVATLLNNTPSFTGCSAPAAPAGTTVTVATSSANGSWMINWSQYTSNAIAVVALPKAAAVITVTVPGVGACLITTNPNSAWEVQGQWVNGTPNSTYTIDMNQLAYGTNGAAACTALGLNPAQPAQFSATLVVSNAITVGM